MKKTVASLKTLFGFKDIPLNAEGTATGFTEEQMARLKTELGDDYAEKLVQGLDKEIKDMSQADQTLKAMKDEIDAMVAESNLSAEELEKLAKDNADDGNDLTASMQALIKQNRDFKATIQKLMDEPEGDVPAAIIKNVGKNMQHSATHLFATNKSYDAFDKRPWNARLRDGGMKATNFIDDSYIPTLQDDVAHFVRENPQVINSLFNDYAELPKEWDRRSGVLDRVSDGFVIAAEIVQGRAKGWAPKNRFKFTAEEGKVFRKKIDITFDGFELQQVETMWVGKTQKMDGSHPWKMSFIGFLLVELVKRQKLDDRKAQINGIYVPGPGGEEAGAAVNSQNGLRFLWWYYRDVVKKYRPFTSGLLAGAPTPENIVDYIDEMIMAMPEDERNASGNEIELSETVLKWYRKKAGALYQLNFNTDSGEYEYKENYPVDHPGFLFQPLKDMTKTLFIGITQSKNVQVMDYDVSEKGKFTVQHDKRDTNIFADYRLGIRFIYVGMKRANGEPEEFEMQKLWSNNMPLFNENVTIPAFDDESGILQASYPSIKIDKNWRTDITEIEGNIVPGQILRITGNSALPGVKNLKDNAVFDLQGDYPLNTPGTITLFVKEDKTLLELERSTVAPVAESTDVSFNGDTIDANDGTVFRFTGVADTAFDEIINGVEGKTIRIYGTDAVDIDLTFAAANTNYKVNSNASLGAAAHYLQFTKVSGKWRETKRVIA
ncbi:MAG: hypothetical protein V4581_16660 [Bacteroidota bacterium]